LYARARRARQAPHHRHPRRDEVLNIRSSAAQLRFGAAIVALAAIWLVMLLWGRGPLDRAVYEGLYAGDQRTLLAIARALTALGEPTLLIAGSAACALWLWYAGRGRLGVVVLLVVTIGRALSEGQKYWIARARPDLEPHLVIVKTSSFPSGHATNSMIFYLSLAVVLTAGTRSQRPAVAGAVLLSLLIGASRVMLGVHWPSDVIGGWAFGMLWVMLTLRRAERLFRTDSEMDQSAL
jgi:membrane-associated phospholipid phosphatase